MKRVLVVEDAFPGAYATAASLLARLSPEHEELQRSRRLIALEGEKMRCEDGEQGVRIGEELEDLEGELWALYSPPGSEYGEGVVTFADENIFIRTVGNFANAMREVTRGEYDGVISDIGIPPGSEEPFSLEEVIGETIVDTQRLQPFYDAIGQEGCELLPEYLGRAIYGDNNRNAEFLAYARELPPTDAFVQQMNEQMKYHGPFGVLVALAATKRHIPVVSSTGEPWHAKQGIILGSALGVYDSEAVMQNLRENYVFADDGSHTLYDKLVCPIIRRDVVLCEDPVPLVTSYKELPSSEEGLLSTGGPAKAVTLLLERMKR